jgi:hypothetical protein
VVDIRIFASILQEVGIIRTNGAADAVEREDNREPHGDLSGLGGYQEKAEDLTGVGFAVRSVERHERYVHRVEHDFDAHERGDDVSPNKKPNPADGEEYGAEQNVVIYRNHE